MIKSSDDDCTSCNDVDECDAAIVATKCFNRANCGDADILLGISIFRKIEKLIMPGMNFMR